MKLRKAIAFLALAATVAGCASPQLVTRDAGYHQGINLISATAVSGMYR